MNRQHLTTQTRLLFLLVLSAMAFVACTADTLQVGILPTPTATATPAPSVESYLNPAYGFAFQYPSTWTLAEEPNVVKLSQGSLTLRIGYRWADELVKIDGGRTGVGAGDFIYGGKVFFLDQAIPAQVLEYERKDKAVFYGGAGFPIEAGDLVFSICLEDLDGGDYSELDISKELQAEAIAILESFERTGVTRTPPIAATPTAQPTTIAEEPEITYTNAQYGFSFQHPSDWVVQDQGSHFVRLGQGPLSLYIGYMWLYESVDIWSRTGLPAGDFQARGTVSFLGQELTREVLVYEGVDRVVFYNGPNSRIEAGDLVFSIYLDDVSAEGSAASGVELQTAADEILQSFALEPALEPISSLPVIGWYGSVHSLPAEANHNDYLSLLPEGAGKVGLVGESPAVESMIVDMRDKEPPNKYAHFWGTLSCGVSDYAGCQLMVTHMRPDGPGPLFNPDPVEGWEGTLITDSAWAQIDDALVLAGPYPVHYGVWSEDPAIAAQLENYRNSGVTLRVWGQVTCGVMDANGCQIQVSRVEEAGAAVESPAGPSEWISYTNDDYGFTFQYPADWTLEIRPETDLGGGDRWPEAVSLSQGNLILTIQYLRMSDMATGDVGLRSWVDPQEITVRETVTVMGQEEFRDTWAHEGAVKAVGVSYGNQAADLGLQSTLCERVTEELLNIPEAETIPESALAVLDGIVDSLALTR
jgi:hypothetical protein